MIVIGEHQLSLKQNFQFLGEFAQHSLSGWQHTLLVTPWYEKATIFAAKWL